MKVTIVLPCWNSAARIKTTIKSVQAQTYSHWELIVVDDASEDNSISIVRELAEIDHRIQLVTLGHNGGAAIARNAGIERAHGDFIAFIDSDDIWLPDKLQTQLSFMETRGIDVSHTSYRFIDEHGRRLGRRTTCKEHLSYEDLLKYNRVGTSTVVYRRKNIGNPLMPNLRNRQDWAYWLLLARLTGGMYYLPEVLAEYTVRKNSISGDKLKLIQFHWLIYHDIEGNGILKSALLLTTNLWRHLMRSKVVSED
jgi:teichuronic acid biosynthesis glycosyltransferase TuaG